MKIEEKNTERTDIEENTEKKPMSALDAINASFAAQKKELGTKKEPGRPSSVQSRKESDRPQKKTQKKKQDPKKEDMKWNLLTGLLVLVIIVVGAVIVFTLYKSRQAEGQGSQTGQATESAALTENRENQESQNNGDSENKSSENKETENTETQNKQTESGQETESTGETESEKTAGVVPEEYLSVLTEDEQKDWKEKEKDSSRVFIQLNQKVEITDMSRVYLRLINPPYSVFTIGVKVYTESSPESILYESDRIAPGTVLEYVSFTGSLDAGSHPSKAEYTVFDEDGNELGTHVVDITLEVNQ